MRPPLPPSQLLLFLFALALLLAFVQVGIISIAFDKLGLSADGAFLLLLTALFGSGINLPLFSMRAEAPAEAPEPPPFPWLPRPRFTGRTMIAVNVGGGLVPLTFSAYLIHANELALSQVGLAVGLLALLSYFTSRPVRGLGIAMPMFLAPFAAALVALLVNPEQSAPLAYVCGTLGVLLGADLLRLRDVRRLGAPVASIGGAGTFDGIFLTGIVAVLLA